MDCDKTGFLVRLIIAGAGLLFVVDRGQWEFAEYGWAKAIAWTMPGAEYGELRPHVHAVGLDRNGVLQISRFVPWCTGLHLLAVCLPFFVPRLRPRWLISGPLAAVVWVGLLNYARLCVFYLHPTQRAHDVGYVITWAIGLGGALVLYRFARRALRATGAQPAGEPAGANVHG